MRRIDGGVPARQAKLLRRGADDQRHIVLLAGREHLLRRQRQDMAVDHRLQPDEAGIGDRHRQSVGGGLKVVRRRGAQIGQGAGGRRIAWGIFPGQFDAHRLVLRQAARRQAELRRAAFLDGPGEQPPAQGRCQQEADVLGASAMADHRDIGGIAAERGDIGAHPL